MRIFNLNRVSPGEAITAQAWNALVECCMEMQSELQRRRLSVGDGLELSESSCGTTLSLDVGDYGEDGAEAYEHPFKVSARIVRDARTQRSPHCCGLREWRDGRDSNPRPPA